ncbi:MAG: 23S rRNA (pseudouridine(1915)-N(3))-methyltransferase RlmH [Bacteroidota bacterium]
MKTALWVIGKTSFSYLDEGMALYQKRLRRYLPFQLEIIPDIKNAKNLPSAQLKLKEGQAVLSRLKDGDHLVLLDEQGQMKSSEAFARFMDQQMMQSRKRLIFLVGGAYGFDEAIYQRANAKLSLSKMTFSHQMVRLFFIEQLYRAMTILRNEPYHNS